jgi:uncharacterized protein YjbI with pentapeptide repeats
MMNKSTQQIGVLLVLPTAKTGQVKAIHTRPRCIRPPMKVSALGFSFMLSVGLLTAVTSPAQAHEIAISPPGATTGVEAVGVNTAIGVSWTAPADGGSPITGYTVKVLKSRRHCKTGGATGCTVSGLSNGTKYKVTVRAENAEGKGSPSAPVKAIPSNLQDCAYIGPYANLQDCDLSDADLTSANLTNSNLSDADLNEANLSEVDMTRANLTDANLAEAALTDAALASADLAGVSSGGIVGTPSSLPSDWTLAASYLIGPDANLANADLSDIDLNGNNTSLESADLANANLTGASLTNMPFDHANLTDADLSDGDFNGDNMSYAELTGINVTNADFVVGLTGVTSGGIVGTPSELSSYDSLIDGYIIGPYVKLTDANLSNLNLADGDLMEVDFTGAILSGTNLAGATLTYVTSGGITGTPSALPANWALIGGYLIGPQAELSDDDLSGLDLSSLDLRGTIFEGGDLADTKFMDADLTGAYLDFANLTDADLNSADMEVVNFRDSVLTGADLADGNFTDANLVGANLNGADLANATWVNTTCPDDTNSDNDGHTCVNNLD